MAPLILQAHVDEARRQHGSTSPERYRSWEGATHAIVLRTRAKHTDAETFVAEWKRAHTSTLRAISEAVRREPYHNYFE